MTDDNRMPVAPYLITWAREWSRFTLAEVKAKAGLDKIQEWEDGKLLPTYNQLETLAKTFHIPVAVFFFPEPPDLPPIDETFRTLPRLSVQRVPSSVRLLLRKARALQISLYELHDGRNPSSNLITRGISMNSPRDIEPTSFAVRNYLGVSVHQQSSWPSVDEAFEQWRNVLIDHGVYVFKDAFKAEDYFGFCLQDDEFPIIYVNNSVAKSRQVFTIFHELAHLLFQTSGIDHEDDFHIGNMTQQNRIVEVSCNAFAGSVLVPNGDFDEVVETEYSTISDARRIARRYCVSTEVILRKLLDRNTITQDEYEAESSGRIEAGRPKTGGGDYYKNQIAYLGRPYVRWALQGYHQHRFDELQLADYLNISPKNVSKFEDAYLSYV